MSVFIYKNPTNWTQDLCLFSKGHIEKVNIQMKKFSTFLIREMQIKTAVRCNFSPIILAKPQNFDIIFIGKTLGNRYSHNLMMGMQNGITPMQGNLAASSKMPYAFTL